MRETVAFFGAPVWNVAKQPVKSCYLGVTLVRNNSSRGNCQRQHLSLLRHNMDIR